jgi:hypothetical protein
MVELIRAEVAEIADPQARGRVKLRSPAMGEGWEAWAEAVRCGAAAPAYQRGDIVLVGFEGGDTDRPIVLGALSPRAAAAGGPERKGQ